jgi:hypothetical protein
MCLDPLWRLLQASADIAAAVRRSIGTAPEGARAGCGRRPTLQALRSRAAPSLRALLAPGVAAQVTQCCAPHWLCWRTPTPTRLRWWIRPGGRQRNGTKGQANFINACLRCFCGAHTLVTTDRDPWRCGNHPLWWIERLKAHLRHRGF